MFGQAHVRTIFGWHNFTIPYHTPDLSGDIMDPKYIKAFHEINERPGVSLQVSCRFA